MRLPLGSKDVSASGGNAELIGRRGDSWKRIAARDLPLSEAIAILELDAGRVDPASVDVVRSGADGAPIFAPGESILWRYGRYVETARVIRDDARGLVVWIPSGSERLVSVPADGRHTRDVPLSERF